MDLKVGNRVYVYKKKLFMDKKKFNKDNLGTIQCIDYWKEPDYMSLDYEGVTVRIQFDIGKNIELKIGDGVGIFNRYKLIKLKDLKKEFPQFLEEINQYIDTQ